MALGSTQPFVKMSTRDVPGGKGSRFVRLKTYHHIVPMSRNLGALTLLDPSGPAWRVMGVLYLYLYIYIYILCVISDQFSKVGNTNSTQGILRLVITANVSVYRLDKRRIIDIVHFTFILTFNFKFCNLTIHNQLILSGAVRNFTNNNPFCYCSVILFQLTLTNVSQRNISENQQLLYT
jgi:hypothetical protein